MRVSTRGDYACRALLSLALRQDDGGPTSVRDIAERTGLPQPYLEKREVIVVNCQAGSLHLELPDTQEFSEFEVAEMIRAMPVEEMA